MPSLTRQQRVEDVKVATALLHPTRVAILTRLRSPASASQVARGLGMPASRVNHHLQRLREAGLVRRAGSRRVRNLTEILYIASARTYVISEFLMPGGEARRRYREREATRPLRNLVALGERLAGDSIALLDEAAADERDVSAYATSMDLHFPDAGSRAAFLTDLLEAVRELRAKYGVRAEDDPDERYKVVVACYPLAGV